MVKYSLRRKEIMWGTIEADAWSRDFSYDGYVNLHRISGHVGNALCKEAYEMLCKALDIQMEYNVREE